MIYTDSSISPFSHHSLCVYLPLLLQPDILVRVGSVLRFLRKEYERDIAEAITSPQDSETQQNYRDGLIFLGCFIIGIAFIWCMLLLILKLKGPSVGCAAGYAFNSYDQRRRILYRPNNGGDGVNQEVVDNTISTINDQETISNVMLCNTISHDEERNFERVERSSISDKKNMKKWDKYPQRREILTQLVFLTLCLITIICAMITFAYTLRPYVDTINHSEIIVNETKDIINATFTSLSTLELASNESQVLIDSLTLDYGVLCPNYTSAEIEQTLGVDLKAVLDLMSGNYSGLTSEVSGNISEISDALMDTERVVTDIGNSFHTFRRYLWILPTVLFPLCFAVILAMSGGFLSMKRQSSQAFREMLSKWILPMLLVLSIFCFMIAMVLAVAGAVGTDTCLADSSSGSPYDTIINILNSTSSTESWRTLALDVASGCTNEISNDYITKLHQETQRIINFIWKSLSEVDSVGQGNLVEYCGADEKLVEFLDGVRDLAKMLYSAQRALKSANETLSCESLYPLYDSAVNELICDDTVSATAWGFVLFLTMGVASMGIVSLRASWSYNVAEDKIFDESEVVENIILDEHEEYLHYISAYKHEWEEYRGVNRLPEVPNHDEGSTDSSSSTEPENGNFHPANVGIAYSEASSVSDSDIVSETPSIEVIDEPDQAFNPYRSSDSHTISPAASVDNISFLSLSVSKTFENEAVEVHPTTIHSLPPSLLQERVDQERDDFDDHLFLTDDDISRDDDREPPDITNEKVEVPKSQVQIIKTKYKMVPSTMRRPNKADIVVAPAPHIRSRPSISQILDELEELSTSKLATPSPGRISSLRGGFTGMDPPPSSIY